MHPYFATMLLTHSTYENQTPENYIFVTKVPTICQCGSEMELYKNV